MHLSNVATYESTELKYNIFHSVKLPLGDIIFVSKMFPILILNGKWEKKKIKSVPCKHSLQRLPWCHYDVAMEAGAAPEALIALLVNKSQRSSL